MAFVVSAVLHALAVAIYPLLVEPPAGPSEPPSPEETALPGLEVVRVAERATPPEAPVEPAPEVESPEEPEEPEGAEAPEDEAPVVERIGPPDRRARTPAEELRPRSGDPRLTAPLPEEVVTVDKEWLARLRVIWALEQRNDSAARAPATAAAARDWTYTDEDGKKWGVSPGKIHLGDVTLPFPFSFSAPWNSEAARNAREDAAILRAALESATLETLEERARAIRERRDRERADGTPPDTTGRGGRGGGAGGGSE